VREGGFVDMACFVCKTSTAMYVVGVAVVGGAMYVVGVAVVGGEVPVVSDAVDVDGAWHL